MSQLHAFVESALEAFIQSQLHARGQGQTDVQYQIFYSCRAGLKLVTDLQLYHSNTFDYLNYNLSSYPDFIMSLSTDIEENEINNTIPIGSVSDTDPLRVRIWAYQKPGSGATVITQLSWGQKPSTSQLLGWQPFQGRIEVSGYAIGQTTINTPTITMQQYLDAFPYNQSALDNAVLPFGGLDYTMATVSLSGGGGSGASAHATLNGNGSLASIVVDSSGSGYSAPPLVTITGDGSGAVALATIIDGIVTSVTLQGNQQSDLRPWVSDSNQVPIIGFGVGALLSIQIINGGSGYTEPPNVTITSLDAGSGAAATAIITNGSVNQVIVTSPGANYSTPPTVTLDSGSAGVQPATAVAIITYSITSIDVSKQGSGYITAPNVTISGGGGTGATAHSTLSGSVTSINLLTNGLGYANPPRVTFTGGGGSGASAYCIMSGTSVMSLVLTSGGYGYTSTPTVTLVSPTQGTPESVATANCEIMANAAINIIIDTIGGGYTSTPTVTIDPPVSGQQATAFASLGSGIISQITVIYSGTGYTTTPQVSFIGGGGSGLLAHAVMNSDGGVASIIIDAPGFGYSSSPTISFGGLIGATAIAILDTQYQSFGLSGYRLINQTNRILIQPDEFDNTYNNGQFRGYGFEGCLYGDALNADNYQDPYIIGSQVATANVILNSTLGAGQISGIQLTYGGTGYGQQPTITFINVPGQNSTLGTPVLPQVTATYSNGSITGFIITNYGAYLDEVVISISPPTITFATATCNISGDIVSIVIDNHGSGYTSPPAITVPGGTVAHAVLNGTSIGSIVIDTPGSGYNRAPMVMITGGGGSGAVAHTVINGSVVSLSFTNSGIGYVFPPTLQFIGGGGVGATGIANIDANGVIISATITDGGSGYTISPIVHIVIESPQESQKPVCEQVQFLVLLVPGTYDVNNNFVPAPASNIILPCFWLNDVITGNTFYNYFQNSITISSTEEILSTCARPLVLSNFSAYLIPPIPPLGFTDAFGVPVSGGDFWWIAGPDSIIGGEFGYGAYTVNKDSEPFFVYQGDDYCGGTDNLYCNNTFEEQCAWYIFWTFSAYIEGISSFSIELPPPASSIVGFAYFIQSTHNPIQLKFVNYVPNMQQVFGNNVPSGYYWLPISVNAWTLTTFQDTSASLDPVEAPYPDVVSGELQDDIPPYYYPFTYGVHFYMYSGYWFSGVNVYNRYNPLYTYLGLDVPGIISFFSGTPTILNQYVFGTNEFLPLEEKIYAEARSDLSLLVNAMIQGGAPYFGGAYNINDIDFNPTTEYYTARAHAEISGGAVTAIILDYPGQMYGNEAGVGNANPNVTITGGGGSGATAVVPGTNTTGSILPPVLTSGGSGYTSVPLVTIDPPTLDNESTFVPTGSPSLP